MKHLILGAAVLFSVCCFSHAEDPAAKAPVKLEVAEKRLAEGAQLLDVRTEEEWLEGHLKDAKRVAVTEDGFLEKAKAVLDKNKPVVVYCRSGKRSAMATEQLRKEGFTVHDMEGGITAWLKAGKEVVRPEVRSDTEKSSPSKEEEIKKLQSEIQMGKQNIQDIEAFVEMERAKLKKNPDYDSSFLEEALHEQQEIRKAVESGEKSLREISPVKE